MSERDDLVVRAEVLSKLADQLGEQLAVERRANDELRTILRDGPGGGPREQPACVAPVATTLAAVAVGMSICAAVAASWLGSGTGSACHARQVAVSAAAASAVPKPYPATVTAPTPSVWPAGSVSPWVYPPPGDPIHLAAQQQQQQQQEPWLGPNPRDCGRVVNATAARCFVDATGGNASGEYMLRNLILAYTLLGERTRGAALAERYFTDFGGSPFAQQIRQLGYNP
jgi:hypothetical protein